MNFPLKKHVHSFLNEQDTFNANQLNDFVLAIATSLQVLLLLQVNAWNNVWD